MYTKEEIEELEAKDKIANHFCSVFRSLYPLLKQSESRGEIVLDEKYGDVLIKDKSGNKRISGLSFWHKIAEIMKSDVEKSYIVFKNTLIA